MQRTLCPQRKAELDMSGYTAESPLPKCLFKVNKNKRPICILIDNATLATRIHHKHNNDTDLHEFMREVQIAMFEILHSWRFVFCVINSNVLAYIQHD